MFWILNSGEHEKKTILTFCLTIKALQQYIHTVLKYILIYPSYIILPELMKSIIDRASVECRSHIV